MLNVNEDCTVDGLIDLSDPNKMQILQHDTTNQKTKFKVFGGVLCPDSPEYSGWLDDVQCRKSGNLDFGEIVRIILYALMRSQSPFKPS